MGEWCAKRKLQTLKAISMFLVGNCRERNLRNSWILMPNICFLFIQRQAPGMPLILYEFTLKNFLFWLITQKSLNKRCYREGTVEGGRGPLHCTALHQIVQGDPLRCWALLTRGQNWIEHSPVELRESASWTIGGKKPNPQGVGVGASDPRHPATGGSPNFE